VKRSVGAVLSSLKVLRPILREFNSEVAEVFGLAIEGFRLTISLTMSCG
jgi:hypothetical protein